MSRRVELTQELKGLFTGPRTLGDSAVPPLVFVVVNAFAGVGPAAAAAIGVALAFVVWRLVRGRALIYALGGIGGVLLAAGLAVRSGRAEAYFLPGIISSAGYGALALITIPLRRPLAAWSSWIFRGWPLEWYWRDDVRPAYTEVTWLWAAYFFARGGLQWWLFDAGNTGALAAVKIASGWPALLVLLTASYLYGNRRLERLGGPSVNEYRRGAAPPFTERQPGF